MANDGSALSNVTEISFEEIKENYDSISKTGMSIFRTDDSGKMYIIRHEDLAKIIAGKMKPEFDTLYASENWQKELEEKLEEIEAEKNASSAEVAEKKTKEVKQMDADQKAQLLEKKKTKVNRIAEKEGEMDEDDAHAVLDASTDANVVSNVTFQDSIEDVEEGEGKDEDKKKENAEITKQTKGLVYAILKSVRNQPNAIKLLNSIKAFDGASSYAHSNRVFMNFVEFITFYNKKIDAGFVGKLRRKFRGDYKHHYAGIFRFEKIFNLEDAFERGMSRIEDTDFINYSVGALMHDIGKIIDPVYFESGVHTDHKKNVKHVVAGYNIITKTTDYPTAVRLMVGFHHEYYNSPAGYGVFRSFLSKHPARTIDQNMRHAISYDPDSVLGMRAMGFFPAKVLEIVDVYDTVEQLLKMKKIEEKLTPYKILKLIKTEYIEKQTRLDPVLFDLFIDFMDERDEENLRILKLCQGL